MTFLIASFQQKKAESRVESEEDEDFVTLIEEKMHTRPDIGYACLRSESAFMTWMNEVV